MATPQSDFAREQAFMGIGNLPYSDYWGTPPESQRGAFTEEARSALRLNDAFVDERDAYLRNREASRAANDLVDRMPYMQDTEIQRSLIDNPRILATEEAKNIEDFLALRERLNTPKPKSDEVLGPRILEKIENPDDREMFRRRVLDEGYSVEEAQDMLYNDDYNRKQESRLAEQGVNPQEFDSLKVNGRFDMGKVGNRLFKAAQDKERAKYDLRGNTPAARQLENASNILRARGRILESQGEDPGKDPLYQRALKDMETAYDVHMRELSGEIIPLAAQVSTPTTASVSTADQANPIRVAPGTGDPTVAPAAPVQTLSFADEAFQRGLTPEQAQEEFNRRQGVNNNPVKQEIDNEWTDAKLALGSRLLKQYPNTDGPAGNPAVLLARAIYTDADAPGDEQSLSGSQMEWETGMPSRQSYMAKTLRELSLNPDTVIFKEPGNERTGTQDVRAGEVLRAWAQDFLTAKGLLNARAPAVQQEETEADRIAAKYLNK